MHLGEWLKRQKLSQEELGKRLNPPVSQSLVSQWIHGETRITLAYSLQIQRLTGDQVMPADCAAMFGASRRKHR